MTVHRMSNASLKGSNFADSQMAGVDMRGARMPEVKLTGAMLAPTSTGRRQAKVPAILSFTDVGAQLVTVLVDHVWIEIYVDF